MVVAEAATEDATAAAEAAEAAAGFGGAAAEAAEAVGTAGYGPPLAGFGLANEGASKSETATIRPARSLRR